MSMRQKRAVIFDLDQTLFDIRHRLHFIQKEDRDWDGFHGAMHNDTLNMWAFRLLWMYDQYDYDIVILTGRNDRYRDETRDQLMRHEIPYNMLLMRQEGDTRPAKLVKLELYRERIAGRYQSVDAIYDDNAEVCRAFMDEGVTAMLVMTPLGDVTDLDENDATILDSERNERGFCRECGYLISHEYRCRIWLNR